MKCKNCGGEVRLEDLYCPYCGSPNEEAIGHARDMQHYQNEFQQTKEDVIDRAGRQSRAAVRIALTAFLLLAIAANIFIQANSYSIHRMWKELQMKENEDRLRQKIESYMAEEDYIGLSAYCGNINLYSFRDLYDDYYPVVRAANQYRYVCEQIMKVINHGKYSDPENYTRYIGQYVQQFYESLELEKYSYYDSYENPVIRQQIENMAADLEAVYIAYLSMTPEEAESMHTISQGNRMILVEKGLEQYLQEAGDE